MRTNEELFLDALAASLRNQSVSWTEELDAQEWKSLFRMAQVHRVLPLIFGAVYDCPAARMADPAIFAPIRQSVRQMVMLQTMKTDAFLRLLPRLMQAGVTPLVVKGLVCRDLYPNPDWRMSGDEDLCIPPEQFATCDAAMTDFGMTAQGAKDGYEVPYRMAGSPLYIELHKHLFPPESDAYGDWNRFFDDLHTRAVVREIQGVPVPTLAETDHLFYLICHSLKHFLHSGVGIRQVCDICLFARANAQRIDWLRLRENCRSIRAEKFAAGLFAIGRRHLGLEVPDFAEAEVDEAPLLADILDAGIYGDGSMSRKHSSTVTLRAASGKRKSVLASLFPPASQLQGRYPYLSDKPYLLPVAWAQRLAKYRKEAPKGGASEALEIGARRVELLKTYGIVDDK